MNPKRNWLRKAVSLLCAAQLMIAMAAPAFAQGDVHTGEVGSEVKSTNTPGGGGGLESQGLTGERTPWLIAHAAPTTAGSAVINIHITYYHCQACRDKAKKAEDDAKKKAAEEAKKKAEEAKKKKDGAKPPVGPDVITFDPRTHEIKDGKVVRKTEKSEDHSNCPRPEKFECSEHYRWWLENHDHMAKPADVNGHENCDKPEKFECGEHYFWWLKNHKHRTEAPKAPPVEREYRYDSLDRPVKRVPPKEDEKGSEDPKSLAPQMDGMQIVLTGTVVAGENATASVLDGTGNLISGVVLELPDGQKVKTDERGHATFKVPFGKEALTLLIGGTLIQKTAWAWNSGAKPTSPQLMPGLPEVHTPPVLQPGQPINIPGMNLPPNQSVAIDGKPAEVLASSPTATVVDVPKLTPGNHWVTVSDGQKTIDVQNFDAVQLQIDPPKTMMIGQVATYKVRVVGTQLPVDISAVNQTPGTIALDGKARAGFVRSSGGAMNVAELTVRAISPGPIRMPCSLVSTSSSP